MLRVRTEFPDENIGLLRGNRLRACAIILRGRWILLSRPLKNPFWELPGGRIEAGEMSSGALVRELQEELGLRTVPVGRLVFLIEHRFAYGPRACTR